MSIESVKHRIASNTHECAGNDVKEEACEQYTPRCAIIRCMALLWGASLVSEGLRRQTPAQSSNTIYTRTVGVSAREHETKGLASCESIPRQAPYSIRAIAANDNTNTIFTITARSCISEDKKSHTTCPPRCKIRNDTRQANAFDAHIERAACIRGTQENGVIVYIARKGSKYDPNKSE